MENFHMPVSPTVQPCTSFNSQVASLRPGEACSKVRALNPELTVGDIPRVMPSLRQQIRNSATSAVTRAREATGNQYTIQVGEAVMPDGGVYLVAIVTRKD